MSMSPVVAWRHAAQIAYDRLLQRLMRPVLTKAVPRPWRSVLIALILGMGAATLVIAALHVFAPTTNLSLIYLIVVIWLAILYGRLIAIIAAFVAFIAYDLLFVPPVFRLTVDDPAEYVALGALLVTGVVIGQLTAELRRQVQVARESQQRTSLLYALSQEIAGDHTRDQLLATLTQRVQSIFAPTGVQSCAVYLPDSQGALQLRAVAQTDLSPTAAFPPLDAPVALTLAEDARATQTVLSIAPDQVTPFQVSFLPLSSQHRVIGILGLIGTEGSMRLLTMQEPATSALEPQAEFFAAVCDQVALALERAALQQEAIQVQALRESERLKETFLDSVTHDLRTPIAAIQASAASILQPDIRWDAEEAHELVSVIATSAKRLERLVDNLLALSRLEAGVAPLTKVWYPINDIIATALRSLDLAGQMDDHPVQVTVADDLLEAPMDPFQMERVMTNLVENALRYSPPGSPVQIAARADDTEMEVRVSDQGIGIPSEQHEAIFDKFFRLQRPLPWTAVPPPQGTGLGLAICANIVRAHGGRIWAESTPGAGATFIFTLPLTGALPSASREETQS